MYMVNMFQILLCIVILHFTNAFQMFQQRIPNGAIVPNPCNPGEKWPGVGHRSFRGGGPRNSFGLDFKKNNLTWTKALCELDSDGDGQTNGRELGDPNCNWTPGSNMNLPRPTSHPGLCESFISDRCRDLPSEDTASPQCEAQEFKCDLINEAGVNKLSLRMPRFEIPAQDTTYMCIIFDIPSDAPYHLIAAAPALDSVMLHHNLLFGCDDDSTLPPSNERFPCGVMPHNACSVIGGFAPSLRGQCLTGPFGFPIGKNGQKKIWMQNHYNNPAKLAGKYDNSGMDIYYTTNLRQFDAAVMAIQGLHFSIPPGQPSYEVSAECSSVCTQKFLTGDIFAFTGINHMHLYGRKQKIEVIRNGKVVSLLTDEKDYDFNVPSLQRHPIPITIQKADTIKTTCSYDTQTANSSIKWGLSTQEEMCVGFVAYFPKRRWNRSYCNNFKRIPICQIEATGKYSGCTFRAFLEKMKTSQRIKNLFKVCKSKNKCSRGSYYYRSIIRKNRCFRGDLFDLWKLKLNSTAVAGNRFEDLFITPIP